MYRRTLLFLLWIVAPLAAQVPTTQPATTQSAATQPIEPGPQNFCFVQVTDIHIDPHPASLDGRPPTRGKDTIDWFCSEAAKPQTLEPFGITTPPPSFAIATGDLTEYGVIDDTWKDFETAFRALRIPLYVVPGNHDSTWVAMRHIMRNKYKALHHSFDKFGCHFVGLNSASPQEPVPNIDAATLFWLFRDLKKAGKRRPVFLFLHHPPNSDEFAQPAMWAQLYEFIRPYNIVLMLYGHGHAASHHNYDGIDGVMGGSTFGRNAGYNIISVKDGVLRVVYRYHDPARPMVKLLEKPLEKPSRPKLDITEPKEAQRIRGKTLTVQLAGKSGRKGRKSKPQRGLVLSIDGREMEYKDTGRKGLQVSTAGLTPGGHTLVVRKKNADGKTLAMRSVRFFIRDESVDVAWRRWASTSMKAPPLAVGDLLIFAGTDGKLRTRNRKSSAAAWSMKTGGEILSAPVYCEVSATDSTARRGLICFGSGDGRVYAVDMKGEVVWTYEAKASVYGWPLVADDVLYIGDNSGRLHAIDVKTGAGRWVFERATYGIESRPAICGDSVLFGAWDGYLYSINRKDGSLQWRSWGPKSSDGKAARYYAPADCGPVVLGDRIFVCDRGYLLAPFAPDGTRGETIATEISAIAPAADGRAFYARGKDDRLVKFDAEGKVLWETKVPTGRFPAPPTEHDGTVFVCSNTGLLTVLAADTGRPLWSYQVTTGFHVMAPVAVDDDGYAVVVGMDGWISRLRKKR